MDTNNTSTSATTEPTPGGADSTGQTSTPQSQTASGSQKTSIDSLPPDIQDYIARLRSEAEEANKQRKAEAKAKAAAEEDRLRKQGEFETLAKQHEARVKELEPIQESYTRLAGQLQSQIEQDIKDWPVELKSFDPGKDAPVEQRLEWVQKSKPLLEKLQQQARGAKPGNGPNQQRADHTPEMKQNEFEKKLAAAGKYPRL